MVCIREINILREDNKKFLKYLVFLFIGVVLTYRLPHDSYSISQYIIRPIKVGKGTIFLSGIIPLVVFIIGIKGIFKLERFAEKSKMLIFLLVVIIIIPIMKWSLNFTRTNYHWVMRDGLNAVDLEDSHISLGTSEDELTIEFDLELIDYSRSENEFNIRVYLPETLVEYLGQEVIELEDDFRTYGNLNVLSLQKQVKVSIDDQRSRDSVLESRWYEEEVIYELYNDNEIIKIVDHGL